jgi:hypothetical protein
LGMPAASSWMALWRGPHGTELKPLASSYQGFELRPSNKHRGELGQDPAAPGQPSEGYNQQPTERILIRRAEPESPKHYTPDILALWSCGPS